MAVNSGGYRVGAAGAISDCHLDLKKVPRLIVWQNCVTTHRLSNSVINLHSSDITRFTPQVTIMT
jgi:hypothetical protein